MKRRVCTALGVALLAALLAAALGGCAKSNGLLAGASPETSALALYTYDGTAVTRQFLFDQAQETKLLEALAKTKATQVDDWQPTQAAAPIYALVIGGKDGTTCRGAWSDGHWITEDGAVYALDFDFASLADSYDWDADSQDTFESFAVMPCAKRLTCGDAGWNTALLTEAAPLTPPAGINMGLRSFDGETASVVLENPTDEEWSFGEYFSVQAEVDGVWYEIPGEGEMAFEDIGLILPAGKRQEKHYAVAAYYGELPAGQYRLVVEGLSVPFTVK